MTWSETINADNLRAKFRWPVVPAGQQLVIRAADVELDNGLSHGPGLPASGPAPGRRSPRNSGSPRHGAAVNRGPSAWCARPGRNPAVKLTSPGSGTVRSALSE